MVETIEIKVIERIGKFRIVQYRNLIDDFVFHVIEKKFLFFWIRLRSCGREESRNYLHKYIELNSK